MSADNSGAIGSSSRRLFKSESLSIGPRSVSGARLVLFDDGRAGHRESRPVTSFAKEGRKRQLVEPTLSFPSHKCEHTPPTTTYPLPVLGGRNDFAFNVVFSEIAAASKASLALILLGEKAEATSRGSCMSFASFKRTYKYGISTKKR